jgi:outer membrane protein OmpA-like peptidoglycan-associated protein
MHKLGIAVAGALVLASTRVAAAQSSPSADDIINSLRPTTSQLKGPTRGIRPATVVPDSGASPEPAVTRVSHVTPASRHVQEAAPVTAADQADGPSVKLVVDFRSGSAELTPTAEHTLDALGQALTSSALGHDRFRIEGHTDTVGNPETNKALSAHRAEAVTSYLEQKFGVDAGRLEAVGLGSESLLVPTPDQTPEPRNRRVKIVNLGS